MDKNERLGRAVRDRITGLAGVTTARVEYVNGCTQYAVQPPLGADGKVPDATYMDHQRLEVTGEGVDFAQLDNGGPDGGAPANYRG